MNWGKKSGGSFLDKNGFSGSFPSKNVYNDKVFNAFQHLAFALNKLKNAHVKTTKNLILPNMYNQYIKCMYFKGEMKIN